MNGDDRVREASAKVALHHGRMISASKSWYRREHPDHVVVFNACVADDNGVELWWGDLDLTVDEPKLLAFAAELGTSIHVLYESDARHIGREQPERVDLTPAVAQFTPVGETVLGIHGRLQKVSRDAVGQLVLLRDE